MISGTVLKGQVAHDSLELEELELESELDDELELELGGRRRLFRCFRVVRDVGVEERRRLEACVFLEERVERRGEP